MIRFKNCGYGTQAQGICPFLIPGAPCRGCRKSRKAFDSSQKIPSTNGIEGNSADLVSSKKQGTLAAFTRRLKERAFFGISRINRRHKSSPSFHKTTTEKEKLELVLIYLEDGALDTAKNLLREILTLASPKQGGAG
jgi:hypothetical protein